MVNIPEFIKILETSIKNEYQRIYFELDFQKELLESMKLFNHLYQENRQLKEDKNQLEAKLGEANNIIDIEMELRDFWINKYHELRQVLDEIRKVLNNQMDYREFVDVVNAIEEILDKVKEGENID